ncbi:MAG: alginate export family protein [Deltaproteobacteria bacterium]|nr:alginate export family protein [Deltaproteobacteria bacterium]
MKRLFIMTLALVALAVWTLPAAAEITLDGQYRVRAETRVNADWMDDEPTGTSTGDNTSVTGQRVRLTAKANAGEDVTVKITLQDTRQWGAGQENTNTGGIDPNNNLDLHESWVKLDNLFGAPVAIKVGRQAINIADQRLIGGFEWSNNARSFDAAILSYKNDVVGVRAIRANIKEGPDSINDDFNLNILEAVITAVEDHTFTLYAINAVDNGVFASEFDLMNYGLHAKGKVGPADYSVEYNMQTGDESDVVEIEASAFAITAGFSLPDVAGLRIGVQYVDASGDDGSDATTQETFDNLLPTNHLHYGYADRQAWMNMNGINLNVSAKPMDKLFVKLDYWMFGVNEVEDDLYYASGNTGVAGNAAYDDDAGTEIDLTVKYAYSDAVKFQLGASLYQAGGFIEDSLAPVDSADQTWSYLQMAVNF